MYCCIFDYVLHVKWVFNSVTSTYLGCTLMEHFRDSLIPCRNYIKPRLVWGRGGVVVAKTNRLENPCHMFHFRQAYTGTRSDWIRTLYSTAHWTLSFTPSGSLLKAVTLGVETSVDVVMVLFSSRRLPCRRCSGSFLTVSSWLHTTMLKRE